MRGGLLDKNSTQTRKLQICVFGLNFLLGDATITYKVVDMKKTLEKRYQAIKNGLAGQETFLTDDVAVLFPDMNRNTLNWTLSKLAAEGYIIRVRTGVYAFHSPIEYRILEMSSAAEKIDTMLIETGFGYYISGVDILLRYMHHVPEQYPVILFAEKGARDEITENLRGNGIIVAEALQFRQQYENVVYSGNNGIALLYLTDNFDYAEKGRATTEKAFVDLFYAISRNGYPLSMNEFARMYQNMTRLGAIDKKKMIAAASRRSLQHDIRLIAESSLITDAAFEFAEILRRNA